MSIGAVNIGMGNQSTQGMDGSNKFEGGSGSKEQMMSKLEAAGITKEQVMQARTKGADAVDELFRGSGIQPPSQAKEISTSQKSQAMEGGNDPGQNSLLKQLEDAGGRKEEYNSAVESGSDAVKSLFEKYELSFNAVA